VPDSLIYLDPDSPLGLQNQIREKLVDGVLSGTLPPGHKLPSTRKLAAMLNVSRNTVVLAYQQLIADGYLESRDRSGVYVTEGMLAKRVGLRRPVGASSEHWRRRIRRPQLGAEAGVLDLPNWSDYPYPFIDGKFDAALFPVAEWREANRQSMRIADMLDWSTDSGDADDPQLVEQIRAKLLSRRGIDARSDEILITMGTQNGLYLVSRLLADRGVTVALEEPGNPEFRQLVKQNGATVRTQPVDADGLVVDERLDGIDLVYVTPSHQVPTAVPMSSARRRALLDAAAAHDFVILEDDYECEINYSDKPLPALRSMDADGRVIYVASLSKVLSPAVRLGFIVADPEFIQRARALRRTLMNHPPLVNQRVTALFLSLGRYDTLMMKLGRVLRERRLALRDALNWMRGVPLKISPEVGGTTYWVRMPDDFDVPAFARRAAQQGVLIEPVQHYYDDASQAENCFRMGITSIPVERIREGVATLVEAMRSQARDQVEHLDTASGRRLTGSALRRAMSGMTILYREVYGAPCTIRYHANGEMSGLLGFANEERDTGRWRVDDVLFYRRWSQWNYGEEKGYAIVLDGDQIKFFDPGGQLVDQALVQPRASSKLDLN
jgi:GntR family transcriptional regulator/MocR family aminotransferase